jgi:tetratricopeptide (TPR) repeat protein
LYRDYLAGDQSALQPATEQTRKAWELSQYSGGVATTSLSYAAADNLGFFYYEQGLFSQALDFWRRANGLNTGDPDCVAGLALGDYSTGDPGSAVTLLSSAIDGDPHYLDPDYLEQHDDWSHHAASQLAEILKLLPQKSPHS